MNILLLVFFWHQQVQLFLLAHKYFVSFISSDNQYAGFFTDNKYSYATFIHTYSLRFYDTIVHELAVDVSSRFIGTPEDNNFSIIKAILSNPYQFLVNVLYNLKEILMRFGHPLFAPFYLYFFIGYLFYNKHRSLSEIKKLFILILLLILHTMPILIFHVEIRYMLPLSIIILIIVSRGIFFYNDNYNLVLIIYTILNFIIYFAYLLKNRLLLDLCG